MQKCLIKKQIIQQSYNAGAHFTMYSNGKKTILAPVNQQVLWAKLT